ncbi:MAG: DUF4870 domain-containing protein [Pseudolysinimonas sp.]
MSTPPPANPYAGSQAPMNPQDEKLWATLTHLSPLVAGIIGLPFLGPLIAYLVLRDRGPFIRWHSAQALNFQLTVLIAYVVSGLLTIVIVGFFLLLAVWVVSIVFMIVAAVAANRGEYYRYPLTISFVS